jgi:hypothetical protein
MKNALILVLLVVLAILVFWCFGRSKSQVIVGNPGAKHQRHDHNGKPVDTEECEKLVGQHSDVCIIPISYLQEMTSSGGVDTAMEVYHKETIIWYGDKGESIVVKQMTAVDCSKHDQPDNLPQGSGPFLVDIKQLTPSLTYAHITDNPRNGGGYCYKTNIDVTVNGKTTTIDPHDFAP